MKLRRVKPVNKFTIKISTQTTNTNTQTIKHEKKGYSEIPAPPQHLKVKEEPRRCQV
jgi:hypothetical protein